MHSSNVFLRDAFWKAAISSKSMQTSVSSSAAAGGVAVKTSAMALWICCIPPGHATPALKGTRSSSSAAGSKMAENSAADIRVPTPPTRRRRTEPTPMGRILRSTPRVSWSSGSPGLRRQVSMPQKIHPHPATSPSSAAKRPDHSLEQTS